MSEKKAEIGVEGLEVEQSLLGALLLNNTAYSLVSGFLRPDHFSEQLHGRIYEIIGKMIAAGTVANPLTVRGALPPEIEGLGSAGAYVAHLAAEATTVINAPDYARIVHEFALRRAAAALGSDLTAAAGAVGASARDLLASAEIRLMALGEDAAVGDPNKAGGGQGYEDVLKDAEERLRDGRHLRGATTSFMDLDDKLGGLLPGDLILIGARPSMGKTCIALSMARRMARMGIGVGVDSLEMREGALRYRLLSDELEHDLASVPYKSIAEGRFEEKMLPRVRKAAERLKAIPLSIIDSGNRLAEIPAHIRRARKECEAKGAALQVFMIDYLGLIRPGDRYAGNRVSEVTEISNTIKALAKREHVAIVALHQLSRANEGRDDKRPRLSDLRDSGALEQDADVVMFVHREYYYLSKPGHAGGMDKADRMGRMVDEEHVMEIIIDKQRSGPTGAVRLWCDMATNSVRNISHMANKKGER